jgi:hypothetical protein
VIEKGASANPVVEQDGGKRMHAVYYSRGLEHRVSDDGVTWRHVETLADVGLPRLAVAPDHTGAVVGARGEQIRLARIGAGAVSSPSTASSKTIKVAGGSVTLAGPKACVPAHESFRVRVTAKRGGRLRSVKRVLFYFDGRSQGAPTKAPFSVSVHQLFIPGGTAHQIKARITIKLRSGKSLTRTIAVHFTYCPE